ncbi:phytoene desaturase family protein [Catellatospora bangladeshensis]|uniref:phytoene desaturase family protein n=1 Tax=Catellatospora bangladeshensis TaxID=310355 RepID=UPI00361F41FF
MHPLGAGSPVFRAWPLERHGLHWVEPDVALAHPFPDGTAATLARSVAATAASLGMDGPTYRRLVGPFLGRWDELSVDVMRPPLAVPPRHPLLLARFGLPGALPAALLAHRFRGRHARALVSGLAAHVPTPLRTVGTGGVALMFALAAHAVSWPMVRGGSQRLSDALAAYLRELGGKVVTGCPVSHLDELPRARAYLLDVVPRHLAALAAGMLPEGYRRRLRALQPGPAVFKIDYALSGPVPWTAPACREAGTVHLGPSMADIDASLCAVRAGRTADHPFLITAQPGRWDPGRAPPGSRCSGRTRTCRTAGTATSPPRSRRSWNGSPPASGTWCSPARSPGPPRCSGATRTTSAATSPVAGATACTCCCGRRSRPCRTPPPTPPCSCARRRPRPAPACTACAATTPPGWRCGACSASGPRRTAEPWTGSPHRTSGGAGWSSSAASPRSTWSRSWWR